MNYSTLPLFAYKTCTKCGESKPLAEFHKGRDADGLRQTCKVCTNAQNRDIYEKNKSTHLESKRRYRAENPDARRATIQKHTETHKQQWRAYNAVHQAIREGRMLPARECTCAHCGKQAATHHHWSYEPEHWLDTIPLCRVCHGKEHRAYE